MPVRQAYHFARILMRPEVIRAIDRLLELLFEFAHDGGRANALALELPSRTVKGIPVPNTPIQNTEVLTIPIKGINLETGTNEPLPSGDTYTATSSDPGLAVETITDANGNPALVVKALVPTLTGASVEVTDSMGLKPAIQLFDVTAPPPPVADALVLDMADATITSQPSPVAAPAVGP